MDIHTANTLLDLEFMLVGEDDSANGVMPVDTVELSGALKRAYQLGQQTQHAKTWAMRGEADVVVADNMAKNTCRDERQRFTLADMQAMMRGTARLIADDLRALPCPPLEMGE